MKLWQHQARTLDMIRYVRHKRGVKRLCVQGPTGAGKTVTFLELIKEEISNGGRAIVYTNRRTIRQQISDVLEDNQVWHGVRAAGEKPALNRPVQVSSIMTERVRSLGVDASWDVHDATLVIVDEAHSQRAKVATTLLNKHHDAGAFITGFTATPVGIASLYDEIISMAELSELRQSGVLVPCIVYAPEEVDMTGVAIQAGEFNLGQAAKRVRETIVVGKVIDHWKQLNPQSAQTVLFAPGVKESRWFAEQFNIAGYRAAHIDAKTSNRERKRVFSEWAAGDIQVVCNFGILREGFDLKSCRHAILCQPTNKLSTYLQIVGRVIRSAPGKSEAILQDHIGAYWRHGSPNQDRTWALDDTDASLRKERKEKEKAKKDDEGPFLCVKCGCVRHAIPGFYSRCPKCGYEAVGVEKIVRQTNGKLKVVKQKKEVVKKQRSASACLKSAIYTGSFVGMTAGQVMAIAMRKHGRYIRQHEVPDIRIPLSTEPCWNQPAGDVWPWAQRRK